MIKFCPKIDYFHAFKFFSFCLFNDKLHSALTLLRNSVQLCFLCFCFWGMEGKGDTFFPYNCWKGKGGGEGGLPSYVIRESGGSTIYHVYSLLKHIFCSFFSFFFRTLFYSAHIHTIESSWRLADVLACSQKVSHPGMRLVSAASRRIIPFSLLRTLVHAGFCMFPQSCDLRTETGSL
jgi:hypothetical protein